MKETTQNRQIYKRLRFVVGDIIDDFTRLSGGYAVWYSLSVKQRTHLIDKWRLCFMAYLFPPDFKQAVALACLGSTGIPTKETHALYKWAVAIVFSASEVKMYRLWCAMMQVPGDNERSKQRLVTAIPFALDSNLEGSNLEGSNRGDNE